MCYNHYDQRKHTGNRELINDRRDRFRKKITGFPEYEKYEPGSWQRVQERLVSMLSQIERNLVNPSISTLKSIAQALEVPMFKFFKEEKPLCADDRKKRRK